MKRYHPLALTIGIVASLYLALFLTGFVAFAELTATPQDQAAVQAVNPQADGKPVEVKVQKKRAVRKLLDRLRHVFGGAEREDAEAYEARESAERRMAQGGNQQSTPPNAGRASQNDNRPVKNDRPQEMQMRKSSRSFDGDLRRLPRTKQPDKIIPERKDPPRPFSGSGELAPIGSGVAPMTRPLAPNAPTAAAPSPSVSVNGLDKAVGSGYPPDTVGDVGPNHYIQSINSYVGIYNKTGAWITGLSLNTLMSQGSFGNLCDSANLGDPVVLYDTFEDRWVISDFAFSVDGFGNIDNPPGAFQCTAVSKTGDPVAGGWNFYSIQFTDGLNDYPKLGVWPDGIYMSANMFGFAAGGSYQGTRVFAMNKAQMYAGASTAQVVSFTAPSGEFSLLPANARLQTGTPPAGSPNYFAVVWQYVNAVSIYKFQVNWDSVGLSSFTGPFLSIAPTGWGAPPNTVPTLGGNSIDTLAIRLMMQNQYTNISGVESVWQSHTVQGGSSTQSAVRYYQVGVTGGTVAVNTTQAATWNPDGHNRFSPSLAVDRAGNMLLGYSVTSSTMKPAIRYAGRLTSDPLNTLAQTETSLIDGAGTQVGNCGGSVCARWGDYSAMSVAPDGCTFWYTQEYYAADGLNYQTRIGATAFPSCTAITTTGTLQGTVTAAVGGTPLSGATVKLGSRTATTNGSGVYSFSGLPPGTYPAITASMAGYNTGSASNIVVTGSATTTQNFALSLAVVNACVTDTAQADFQRGTFNNVDLTVSPGNVQLSQPTAIDQQNASLGTSGNGVNTTTWIGQTFQAAVSGSLIKADVNLFCASCTGTAPSVTVSVRATSAGLPTGADLAAVTFTGSTSGASGYFTATFPTPPTLTAGVTYALLIRAAVVPSPGTLAVTRSGNSTTGADVYAGGQRVTSTTNGSSWSVPLTGGVSTDIGFKTYIYFGYSSAGDLASATIDANPLASVIATWNTMSWTASVPANTNLRFQVAASNNANGPFNFVGSDNTAATYFTTSGASLSQFNGFRYLKYKAFLTTTNGSVTPTLNDVTICYNNGKVWTGATSIAWTTGTNWNPGGAPATSDSVIIPNTGVSVNPTITSAISLTHLTLHSSRTLTIGTGGSLAVSGVFTSNGTVAYTGTAAQSVQAGVYNNLIANNSAGATLGGNVTVNGALTLTTDLATGANTLTLGGTATCAGGQGDVIGTVLRNHVFNNSTPYCFGHSNNQITFGSGAVLPTAFSVTTAKTAPSGTTGNVVTRSYTLTPTGGSFPNATVRLHYLDSELNGLTEGLLQLWRHNGTVWEAKGGTLTNGTPDNYIEATGINGFSPWAVGGPTAPTAVRMSDVAATALDGGVRLQWRTGYEVDNLGFNVYREENGERKRITPSVVAGSALAVGERAVLNAGRSYAWWDAKGSAQASYWIEDLDLNGGSTWHGPFTPLPTARVATATETALTAQSLLLERAGRSLDEATATRNVTRSAGFKPFSLSAASTNARNLRSLANERAIKISVKQEGWYRIAQPQLVAAGLDAASDPRGLRLFVDGEEIACHVTGADDGRFDATDALEFYGLGLDTAVTDTRVYWLIAERTTGARITKLPLVNTTAASASYAHTVERRDRTLYFAALLNGEAENFFGAVVTPSAALDQIVRVPSLDRSYTGTATLEVALQGVTMLGHTVGVKLNGNLLGFLNFSGRERGVQRFTLPQQQLNEGDNTVTLQGTAGASDYSLVAHLRVTYQRLYQADNDALAVGVPANRQVTINGFTSANVRVFDVTGANTVVELAAQVQKSGTSYSVSATPQGIGTRRLLALNADRPATVAGLKANTPSQWLKPNNNADLLIVTHGSLAAEFAPLAVLRRAQGLRVMTVDVEDVYDELNHGHKSLNALNSFLTYAASSWAGKLRYVLLAGDASYDPRNYTGKGDSDLVPTRLMDVGSLETASDDALADFNVDGLPDLSIGRLPARTAAEARRMVERLLSYERATPSKETVLVSDSNDSYNFETMTENLRALLPNGQQANVIARGKLGDAAARTALLTALNRGPRVINYAGHGSFDLWRGALLTRADVLALSNGNQPSVYVMMTCLNGYFLEPSADGLSEALLKSANGGAVAAWASSGFTGAYGQSLMNRAVFPALFTPGKFLGDATREAKAATADADVRRTWILFGDPTMKLR